MYENSVFVTHFYMITENQNIEWKESWRDEYIKWICGFAGLPQPIFDLSFGGLQIEFVLTPENAEIETSVKTSVKIIQLLILNSDLTIPEMAEQIGISERSIQRNLQKLQKDHKIERIGPDKGGYWSVIK